MVQQSASQPPLILWAQLANGQQFASYDIPKAAFFPSFFLYPDSILGRMSPHLDFSSMDTSMKAFVTSS